MDYVRINGTIDASGFTVGWWGTPTLESVPARDAEPDPEANWLAIALDKGDSVLARAPVSVVDLHVCPAGRRRQLNAVLAIPDNISAVAILQGGRQIFRRLVPERAALRMPEHFGPKLRRQNIELPLHIDGPEPRSGAYVTASWEAPNHPPMPLGLVAASANSSAVNLDLIRLPGGEGCRLSVTYFDGIRSMTTASSPLSLEACQPMPVILTPASGKEMLDDSLLTLTGRLDGDGDPEKLEWLLDDEVIATGCRAGVARPAAGPRTVTLRYGAFRSSVNVKVLPAPTPENQPQFWEPPWRSAVFRSLSSLHVRSK